MNRRGFIGSILALGAAPAVVKAANLMPVRKIIVPPQQIVVFGESTIAFSAPSMISAKLWADALYREINRPSSFDRLNRLMA